MMSWIGYPVMALPQLSLILIIVSRAPGPDYATEGLYGIMIFIVLPTLAIGLWRRRLPIGIGLTGLLAFSPRASLLPLRNQSRAFSFRDHGRARNPHPHRSIGDRHTGNTRIPRRSRLLVGVAQNKTADLSKNRAAQAGFFI